MEGMKHFHYVALAAAILLAPAFVLAEETSVSANADATLKADLPAQTGKPRPLVAPGQILKNIRENASSPRADIKNTREDARLKIEAKKEEVRAKVDAAKEKAREKFSQAVQISVNNIIDRLTGAAEHLGTIATRIDSRISELQAKGINMDASIALLTSARSDITTAQDKITAVGAALSAALANATPKTEMAKVRAAVKAAEDALRTAKGSLKATLDSIKAANINQ